MAEMPDGKQFDKEELARLLGGVTGVDTPERLRRLLRRLLRLVAATPTITQPKGSKVSAFMPLLVLVNTDDNTIPWDVVLIDDATSAEVRRIMCPPAADTHPSLFDFGAEFPVGDTSPNKYYRIRVEANPDPTEHNTHEITVRALGRFPLSYPDGRTIIIQPQG